MDQCKCPGYLIGDRIDILPCGELITQEDLLCDECRTNPDCIAVRERMAADERVAQAPA